MSVKYPVYNQSGEKMKEVELNPAVFEVPVKEELVHQALVAQEANSRVVLAHAKQRSEVRGGGRKPWRQKGTGRARAGSTRSPLWKGGGVTFGPTKFRNFEKKLNKKMKKKALFMVLSDKASNKQLVVLDELKVTEIKTKAFVEQLRALFDKLPGAKEKRNSKSSFGYKALVVSPEKDKNLVFSARNLPGVKVVQANSLNVRDILHYDWLVAPLKSLDKIEQHYLNK